MYVVLLLSKQSFLVKLALLLALRITFLQFPGALVDLGFGIPSTGLAHLGWAQESALVCQVCRSLGTAGTPQRPVSTGTPLSASQEEADCDCWVGRCLA